MPVAGKYNLIAVAKDYGDGPDRFTEMRSQPSGGYKGLLALTKAGRHTLHVNLACCGGLQASFAPPQAPVTGTGVWTRIVVPMQHGTASQSAGEIDRGRMVASERK